MVEAKDSAAVIELTNPAPNRVLAKTPIIVEVSASFGADTLKLYIPTAEINVITIDIRPRTAPSSIFSSDGCPRNVRIDSVSCAGTLA